MNMFEAFQEHTTRWLEETRRAPATELNRVHGEVIKLNAQTNSRSIVMKLPTVEARADAATEFVLTEAKALTDIHRARRTYIWRIQQNWQSTHWY